MNWKDFLISALVVAVLVAGLALLGCDTANAQGSYGSTSYYSYHFAPAPQPEIAYFTYNWTAPGGVAYGSYGSNGYALPGRQYRVHNRLARQTIRHAQKAQPSVVTYGVWAAPLEVGASYGSVGSTAPAAPVP